MTGTTIVHADNEEQIDEGHTVVPPAPESPQPPRK